MKREMKLYSVEITVRAYVLAENEGEARSHADEIIGTEYIRDVVASQARPSDPRHYAWTDDSLVYGAHPQDTTLGRVWPC